MGDPGYDVIAAMRTLVETETAAVITAASACAESDRLAEAALDRLHAAVRRAHRAGVPQARLAVLAGKHRNTIATWVGEGKS